MVETGEYDCEGIRFFEPEWNKFRALVDAGIDLKDLFADSEYSEETAKKLQRIGPKINDNYVIFEYTEGWLERDTKLDALRAEHRKYEEAQTKKELWQIAEIKKEFVRGWKRMVEITGVVWHRECKIAQEGSNYIFTDDQGNTKNYTQLSNACFAMAQRIEEIIDQEIEESLKKDFLERFPNADDSVA
jgi:hypothetical protein